MYTPIILGSSSIFRQQQLLNLGIDFLTAAPVFDETPISGEAPQDTAMRLAKGKAESLKEHFPHALIIGSDQVAYCKNQQWGKPLTVDAAQHMLHELSGETVVFYTALVLFNTHSQRQHKHIDVTTVRLRSLSTNQITAYLSKEPDAIFCAGAMKSEGLGAQFIHQIDSTDPHALIGLPIFKLIDFLLAEGVRL